MSADTSLADPDLHLFFADDEIDSLVGVTRLINQLRRDAPEPVLPADQPWEWHHIQASKVLHDPEDDRYKCLVSGRDQRPVVAREPCQTAWRSRATGSSGRSRTTASCACPTAPRPTSSKCRTRPAHGCSCPTLDVPGAEERFVATLYQSTGRTAQTYDPPEMEQRGRTSGIHRATSPDGIHWKVSERPVVWAGDRNATAYDPVDRRWLLTTRRPSAQGVMRQRDLSLWTSTDFRNWQAEAWLLRTRRVRPPQHRVLRHAARPLRRGVHRLPRGLPPGRRAPGHAALLEPRRHTLGSG